MANQARQSTMRSLLTVLVLLFLAAPSLAAPYRGQPTVAFMTPGGHLQAIEEATAIPTSSAPTAIAEPLPGFNQVAQNKTQQPAAATGSGSGYKSPDSNAAFGGTCVQVTLGGHGKIGMTTLEARCVDDAGMWWDTSLDLNSCVGNVGGHLVYEARGAFDATCRPCTLDIIHGTGNVLLKCNCLDEVRFPRYTSLEMGPGVSDLFAVRPVNGQLVCGKHGGMQSPTYFV
ncbi:hypothetical protein MKX08_004217 [Trichoderma sp. CBMAI-0020]|nr:hypothetical protein MKX08_004217 [Trichoderma sp. CBMAI-0020]